ncbi:DUF3833 domain-containing protein [Ideonella livida]|uniref:DUF3833 domain-containing protein n=1 Tax=Ideonella livida TaxID=2707176 RepID=A0A7C9PHM3_9BURK|nr:DUF3833 domain-containing protein [Ideonella livida]NDY91969.1 DUF3833 domain-containing protein [Ideonella livida]
MTPRRPRLTGPSRPAPESSAPGLVGRPLYGRRTQLLRLGAALALAAGLAGCAGPTPADYAGQTPALDLREYFNGPLVAHGVFTDRSGRVVRRFRVDMVGRWQGDQGVLEEDFLYSDGERQRRVWRLVRGPDGRYTGTADDVVGTAQGQAAGNALNWRYTLALPVDGRVWEVQFDDWMYLMDRQVMLNKAVMSKFGLRLGEVTLAFHKP